MRSWSDYLPDGAELRVVEAEALARAHADVMRLEVSDFTTLGAGLGAAAAESARLAVLSRSTSIRHLYRPLLARALAGDLEAHGPDAVFGVLAFANDVLAHGGHIDGHYDYGTRAGLDREIALVERFAREAVRTRALAYVALGAGRLDLARALSDDRALCDLADACEARRSERFYDFVAAFPEADVGYAELMFVARAFVVVLEERGAGGIGAAARWLRDAVHEGPKPLVPYVRSAMPPDGPPPRRGPVPVAGASPPIVYTSPPIVRSLPERPKVRTGRSSYSWCSILLEDVHEKRGARSIAVSSIGDAEVVDLDRGRFRADVPPERLAELDRLIVANDPRAIALPLRPGTIDDARQSLTFVDARLASSVVHRWTTDPHPSFDRIASWLVELGTMIVKRA